MAYGRRRLTRKPVSRRRRATSSYGLSGGRAGTVKVARKVRTSETRVARGSGHLAVFKNPFSQAELQPVIPDGKAVTSVGQRLQCIQQFTQFTADATAMVFIMYPGFGAGLSALHVNPVNGNTNCLGYTNHGSWTMADPSDATVTTSSNFTTATQNVAQGGLVNTWRLVSQGLRLSLVNNSDQNDGWWEAIRCTPSSDPTQFCIANPIGSNTATAGKHSPADARIAICGSAFGQTYSGNWVDNPTYVTGKIRDIHKHMFQLHPNNTDHDFRELKPQYVFGDNTVKASLTDTNGSTGAGVTGANITTDGANIADFTAGNIDFSYDFVMIRIHGRSTAGSETSILAHLISNQECTYAEGAFLERFQRKVEVQRSAVAAASAQMHNVVSPLHGGRGPRR